MTLFGSGGGRARRGTLALLVAALHGCSATAPSSPCTSDTNCPTGSYCTGSGKCAPLPGVEQLSIDQQGAQVSVGHSLRFTATTSAGTVSWSLVEGGAGTIDADGTLHAGSTPGTYHLVATSTADPSKSAQAAFQIDALEPVPAVAAPTLASQGQTGLTARITSPTGAAAYAWTLSGGTITAGAGQQQVTFTAGTGSSLTLVASALNGAGDGTSATVQVALAPVPGAPVLNTPATATTQQSGLTASVTGPNGLFTYQWTISGGTIQGSAQGSSVTFTAGAPGTLTLGCTATNAAGLSGPPASATVAVQRAPVASLSLTGLPATLQAGASTSLTVTAIDTLGQVAAGYTGTVAFTSTDAQAHLPAPYTFGPGDAGTHVFSGSLATAGAQVITATDQAQGALQVAAGSTVTPLAATHLAVTGSTALVAGVAAPFVVTALDRYGNRAVSYTGTVSLTSSDPLVTAPGSATFTSGSGAGFDNGAHTFSVALKTASAAGGWSLTATDGAASFTASLPGIAVVAAPASAFLFGTPSRNPPIADYSTYYPLTARDAFGNTDLKYTGTVVFTSSDPKASLANHTFSATDKGTYQFLLWLPTVPTQPGGTQTLTATDSVNKIQATAAFPVQPGAAATATMTGFPIARAVGKPLTSTITLFDAEGNLATTYSGNLLFTQSDNSSTFPSSLSGSSGVNGAYTVNGTFNLIGTQTLSMKLDRYPPYVNASESVGIVPVPVTPQLFASDYVLPGYAPAVGVITPQTGVTYSWSATGTSLLATSGTAVGYQSSGAAQLSATALNAAGDVSAAGTLSSTPTSGTQGLMLLAGSPGGPGNFDGTGSRARLGVQGLALGGGVVFFDGSANLRQVTASSGAVTTLPLPLGAIGVAALDANTVFFVATPSGKRTLQKATYSGSAWSVAAVATLGNLSSESFLQPLALLDANTLFLADEATSTVARFAQSGGSWSRAADIAPGCTSGGTMRGLAAASATLLYVSCSSGVVSLDLSGPSPVSSALAGVPGSGAIGVLSQSGGTATLALANGPAVATNASGTWVAQMLGSTFCAGIAPASANSFYTTCQGQLLLYSNAGGTWSATPVAGSMPAPGATDVSTGPAIAARFYAPTSIARVDSSHFFVADANGVRLVSSPASGQWTVQTVVRQHAMFVSPVDLSTVYFTDNVGFVNKAVSGASGFTVQQVSKAAVPLLDANAPFAAVDAHTLLAVTQNGLQVLVDNSTTDWSASQTLPTTQGSARSVLAVGDGNNFFAFGGVGADATIYLVNRNGTTWTVTPTSAANFGGLIGLTKGVVDLNNFALVWAGGGITRFTYQGAGASPSWNTTSTAVQFSAGFIPGPPPINLSGSGSHAFAPITAQQWLILDQTANALGLLNF